MTPVQHLHAFLFAFLNAVHPGAAVTRSAPILIPAIVTVVSEEKGNVFGSKEADAVVLAYTAWAESNLTLHAVGDHGTAFGAYQLHMPAGRGDALTQTRAALWHLRRDRAVCWDLPLAAYCSGNCRHGRAQARKRMAAIMLALRKARLA